MPQSSAQYNDPKRGIHGTKVFDASCCLKALVFELFFPGVAVLVLSRLRCGNLAGRMRKCGRQAFVKCLPQLPTPLSAASSRPARSSALAIAPGIDVAFTLHFPFNHASWATLFLHRTISSNEDTGHDQPDH